jgi:toxin ParE1/3/4
MKYVISNEATKDLESIWLYTYQSWSESQADRYIDLIFEEIEAIRIDPTLGKDYSHIREGYYQTKVKSHFIFYKLNRVENQIEIIRILHQMMDIENRLGE